MDEHEIWVLWWGHLERIVEDLAHVELLAELYPDTIYFYAGLVMPEL